MKTKQELVDLAIEILEAVLVDDGAIETYDLYMAMEEAIEVLKEAKKAK